MVGSFVLFLCIFTRAAFHYLLSLGNSRVWGNETFSLKPEALFSDLVAQISIVGICWFILIFSRDLFGLF